MKIFLYFVLLILCYYQKKVFSRYDVIKHKGIQLHTHNYHFEKTTRSNDITICGFFSFQKQNFFFFETATIGRLLYAYSDFD